MRLLPGRDLRSKFQYSDNRQGPCHSYARYLLGGARSFDTACTRMMDVRVGLIVDIHDQAIIHELHCARISAVSPGPTVKHGGAPRRGSEFTRLHARVSNSRLHLLAPALLHRLVSGGSLRFMGLCPQTCHQSKGEGGDSAVSSVISYLERQTQGTPHPPFASVANGQDAHIRTQRGKRCSLQNISGKAETTSTSMTRVCHRRRPSGRPGRPAGADSYRLRQIFAGHATTLPSH